MRNAIFLTFLLCCCLKANCQVNSDSGSFVNYTETGNNVNIAMIAVQGDTFMTGCTSEQDNDCNDSEKPAHRVTVSDFYIGKYEVTQAQWKAVMGNNPSRFKGDNLPVEQISWNDVQEFISKLNAQTGKQYRLPTEAEWEYAARGGKNSKGYKYSGNNTVNEVAWIDSNSGQSTHAVGTKLPNELGIYDMSGNVMEWCSDWLSQYTINAKLNPIGANAGTHHVGRGGSFRSTERVVRVSARAGNKPDDRGMNLGFRLARSSE